VSTVGATVGAPGILKTIRELMNPTIKKSRPIGFTANIDDK